MFSYGGRRYNKMAKQTRASKAGAVEKFNAKYGRNNENK